MLVGIAVASWTLLLISILMRWGFGIAWAVFGFGAEYALFLRFRGGSVDTRAMFVAGVLVLVAEFAFRSALPVHGVPERRVALQSLFALAASIVFAMVVAGVVLVSAGSVRSGLAFEAFGVLAAALALAALLRIASRTKTSRAL